jgi:hypothetical protein
MEKDMIHDFYHNTRSEVKEVEARIKNLDTQMQQMEEAHRTEIKVFMQKVKHLEYEHANNCDRVKIEAHRDMKEERLFDTEREKDMQKEKRKLKENFARDDFQNQTDIDGTEKDLDGQLVGLQKDLDY